MYLAFNQILSIQICILFWFSFLFKGGNVGNYEYVFIFQILDSNEIRCRSYAKNAIEVIEQEGWVKWWHCIILINIQHCCFMAEILPIRCKRLSNQSINIPHNYCYCYTGFLCNSSMMGLLICVYELFWIKVSVVSVTQARDEAGRPSISFLASVVICFITLYFFSFLSYYKLKLHLLCQTVCLSG